MVKAILVGFLGIFSLGIAVLFLVFWWVGRAIDKAVGIEGP